MLFCLFLLKKKTLSLNNIVFSGIFCLILDDFNTNTMNLPQNWKFAERITLILIWTGIFLMPFYYNRVLGEVVWSKVYSDWIKTFTILVIFLLNTQLFIPKLLFPKKYALYGIFVFIVTAAFITLSLWIQQNFIDLYDIGMPPMEIGPNMPPMEFSTGMPLPQGFQPNEEQIQTGIYGVILEYIILSILVIAAGAAYKMLIKWIKEENLRKELEKEQLTTELALLRHQINPHFLMNTLNNIHAMIDLDNEQAKDSVIRLSHLMRYLLYDSSHAKVKLSKETEFIRNYIELMKIRYPKNVKIQVDIPENLADTEIPPLLFVSFLENALKHGVSSQSSSWVKFSLTVNNEQLQCEISNSRHPAKAAGQKKYSGIGLTNIKKTLELLYKNDYHLDIIEEEKSYQVTLKIPLYDH